MAFVEIEDTGAPTGKFFKFVAIGDMFQGRFVGVTTKEGTYGTEYNYTFDRVGERWTISAKTNMRQKLEKAAKDGLLKPGREVRIEYTGAVDTGKQSPMQVFKVQVDDSDTPANAPVSSDDIPF